MVSKRFVLTVITLVVIGLAAAAAIFLAKGYRLSPEEGVIAGTGILSVTSIPDQASVYLDGHLTTATNANINSLPPKKYQVRIVKEGYIPWEKEVEVREGFVTDIKSTLFRAIPTVYPLTYTGAINPVLSPDGQKLVYIVPGTDKKSGLWVWEMSDQGIAFARSNQPHQIGLATGIDYTKATFRWSPDSTQILVSFPEQHLLFDQGRLNDPARDITAIIDPTLRTWQEDQKERDVARLQLIKDLNIRRTASSSALLKWSPDESKFLYSVDGKGKFRVVDLAPEKGIVTEPKQYDLPDSTNYTWLPSSEHLYMVESAETPSPSSSPKPAQQTVASTQQFSKVSVIEFDGFNKSEIYAGNFDPNAVFVWPDGSRLTVISSVPTATASQPNLFGINLK